MKDQIDIGFLRSVLAYDEATGVLTWKIATSNRIKVGAIAGVIASNGRRYINVGGQKMMGHRIAWAMHYGAWPAGDVKQKNAIYDDLRIENLVEQTRQVTAQNRRVNASSKSGHAGVTWSAKCKKWQVHYTNNYKQVFIGLFDDIQEAAAARDEATKTVRFDASVEQKSDSAHKITRRRRQRAAWKMVNASGATAWPSIDAFCADIGDIPQTQTRLLPVDPMKPIGPENFRWSLPLEIKHDFKTSAGRAAYGKAHRANNRLLYKEKELRKSFGIGLKEYETIIASQDGVCAICKKDETAERNGKRLALHVDHNHESGEVRGVLCGNCNVALGMFCDDMTVLRAAISYLKKHSSVKIDIPEFVTRSPHRDWLNVATPQFGGHLNG